MAKTGSMIRSIARPRPESRWVLCGWLLQICLGVATQSNGASPLRSNDVVCWMGGANVVAGQQYGYLESLLRVSLPSFQLRFRSLAHEGDTVFSQPRDYNFPSLIKQLDEAGATVVLASFGQTEALEHAKTLTEFI